jgi:hypothetical protein
MDKSNSLDDARQPEARVTHPLQAAPGFNFSPREWTGLFTLRRRYQHDRDLFSPRELDHLRFIRWLHATGRLDA